ncbi:hypothetical protein [Streptomyces sp. NPDC003483]
MRPLLPPGSLLYAAGGLSGACVLVMGAGTGFLLDRWWGLGAGLVLGMGALLLAVKATVLLCTLQTSQRLQTLTKGDPQGEAAALTVLHAIALYPAAVFPLRPGGVRADARNLRRLVAYRSAAGEGLPRPVRAAAAEALGAIDLGRDTERAQAAAWTVNEAVRECRPGFISLHDDHTS